MNSVQLIGRLVRENDLHYSAQGVAVLKNTIAVNRRFNREESDFINILAFKKTAELITNHFNKGDEIAITGSIQTGSYEKDGRKVYTSEVVIDNITFTSGNKKQGQSSNQSSNQNNNQGSNNSNNEPFDLDSQDLPF